MKILNTSETKHKVLLDVSEAIAHLHRRGIVHRDIKPENVLLLVVEGKIVGPAKVCDFSSSRKEKRTTMATSTMRTTAGLAGTLAYMPPGMSHRQANKTARDVWSFGVLMCEVLEPSFLINLVRSHPDVLESPGGRMDFAKKIIEHTRNISCVNDLSQIVEADLANYLREGIGTEKDAKQGVSILERLCASGNGWAAMRLALCYKRGWEVERDENKAKELSALAHKRGIVGDWIFYEKNNLWNISLK